MLIMRMFNVWAVVLNLCLAYVLYATARNPLSLPLTVVLAVSLAMLPIVLTTLHVRKIVTTDKGFIMSMVGTALLWAPLFLTAYDYRGPFGDLVELSTDASIYIGIALLFLSVFWPIPKTRGHN